MKSLYIFFLFLLVPLGVLANDVTAIVTPVSSPGSNDGAIDLTISGGHPPFVISWSGPNFSSTDEDIFNLSEGLYTVLITDALCGEATMEINVPACQSGGGGGSGNFLVSREIICDPNENSWFVDITVLDGTPYYSYQWLGPGIFTSTSEDISVTEAGTYCVFITDLCGLQSMNCFQVGVKIEGTIVSACTGINNGSINLSVSNGEPPYTYNWSTGFSGKDLNLMSAGTYTITVTDGSGCSNSKSFIIPNEDINITGVIRPTCSVNYPAGNIHLSVEGGTGDYQYQWSHLNSIRYEPYVYSLDQGTYCVTVTDQEGCNSSECFNVTLDPVNGTELILNPQISHVCGNNAGVISIDLPGLALFYDIDWSNGETDVVEIDNLVSGTYTVTVTNSVGCQDIETFEVLNDVGNELSMSWAITPSCREEENGAIDITVSGGTGSYTYEWSNNSNTQDIYNLDEGYYCVTVTAGCRVTQCFSLHKEQFNYTSDISSSCNDPEIGSIDFTLLSGGSYPPYTYNWSNGAQTEDITNLALGDYQLTITNAYGCTRKLNFNVDHIIEVDAFFTPTCPRSSTGGIDLNVSGGTPPYQYTWNVTKYNNNDGLDISTHTVVETSEDLEGLADLTHCVTITDDLGCEFQNCYTVPGSENYSDVKLATPCLRWYYCDGDFSFYEPIETEEDYLFQFRGSTGECKYLKCEDGNLIESQWEEIQLNTALWNTSDLCEPCKVTAACSIEPFPAADMILDPQFSYGFPPKKHYLRTLSISEDEWCGRCVFRVKCSLGPDLSIYTDGIKRGQSTDNVCGTKIVALQTPKDIIISEAAFSPEETIVYSVGFQSIDNNHTEATLTKFIGDELNLGWKMNFFPDNGINESCEVLSDEVGNAIVIGFYSFSNDSLSSDTTGIDTTGNYFSSKGGTDLFILKFSPEGDSLWAKTIQGVDDVKGTSVSLDPSNNLIVTGVFNGTIQIDDETEIVSTDEQAIIIKFDPNGQLLSYKVLGGSQEDKGLDISSDHLGNLYVLSSYKGVVELGDENETSEFSDNTKNLFIVKYDSNFNFLWLREFISDGEDINNAKIEIDEFGDVLVYGEFSDNIQFDTLSYLTEGNSKDYFLAKYSSTGVFLWSTFGGNTSNDLSIGDLATDESGNIFIAGSFVNTMEVGTYTFLSAGDSDIFIIKYDKDGNILWVKREGGVNMDHCSSLDIKAGKVVYTGYFENHTNLEGEFIRAEGGNKNSYYKSFNDVTTEENINSSTVNSKTILAGNEKSIHSNGLLSLHNIYPNPFKRELNIDLYSSNSGEITISVFNLIGQEVSRKDFAISKANNSLKMNLGNQNRTGIYIVKISDSFGNHIVRKVVKTQLSN